CDIDRQGTGLSRPAPRERSGTGTGTGTGTGAGRENRRGAAFLSALLVHRAADAPRSGESFVVCGERRRVG
ncbi:MAG: hypothetical protein SFX73_32020, partial [Kofleriaceae bacterium]|nr:hypothetical protein [Kofleriaceae bacterium]